MNMLLVSICPDSFLSMISKECGCVGYGEGCGTQLHFLIQFVPAYASTTPDKSQKVKAVTG